MSTEKSLVRVEIERQVIEALEAAGRPMTARELMSDVDAAEDTVALVRVLCHMRDAGQIKNGPEVQPGMPGGMTGKGARAVASYRLTPLNLAADREAERPESAPITDSETLAMIAEIEADLGSAEIPPPQYSPESVAFRHGRVDRLDKIMTLLEGHDELMMLYADQQLEGDPIWSLMKAQRTAKMSLL
jgi:hypothetical protein